MHKIPFENISRAFMAQNRLKIHLKIFGPKNFRQGKLRNFIVDGP